MLSPPRPSGMNQRANTDRKVASMRRNEEKDWWILQLVGQAESNGSTNPLPVDLIVAGHAEE